MVTKRGFDELRESILHNLSSGRKTANQIASETGIGWKTVSKHMIYLAGMELVKLSFSNSYFKVFELSEKGKEKIGISEL